MQNIGEVMDGKCKVMRPHCETPKKSEMEMKSLNPKSQVTYKACVKSHHIPKLLQGRSDFAAYMTCEAFEHQPIFALNPGEQKLACIVT